MRSVIGTSPRTTLTVRSTSGAGSAVRAWPVTAQGLAEDVDQRIEHLEAGQRVDELGRLMRKQPPGGPDETRDRVDVHVVGVQVVDDTAAPRLAQARGQLSLVQRMLLKHMDASRH